ncbi:MAG: formimidoylglutamate deiminase [Rhodospirillaceae bacterium]|nr:formimidoylglutamate deiminase [Rhodospirillaceae bacterium]
MPVLQAPRAWLPQGWAGDVRIEIDDQGWITEVAPETPDDGAQHMVGAVVPGMANLHSHAFQRAMAGLTERAVGPREDFWSWRGTMHRFAAALVPDQVEAIAAQLYVEMVKAGYTGVAEFHYLHHGPGGRRYDALEELSLRVVAAARAVGLAITHLPVLYQRDGFTSEPPRDGPLARFASSADEVLQIGAGVASAHAGDPDVAVGLAIHSLRAVPEAAMHDALAGLAALNPSAPVHIHVAEQVKEVEDCLATLGARPVAWLLDHAEVDGRWCLVHATHMDAGEVEGMAATGAVAGLCPATEANLGDGLFALPDYLAAGGTFGIGSDSHISVDPLEELRLLEYGQRLVHRRRAVAADDLEPSTGLRLYTGAVDGGAQALGRRTGHIAPGYRADLVVLDPVAPPIVDQPDHHLFDALVFSGGGRRVRDVMVGGRWVVRDGHHREERQILDAYREAVAGLIAA